MKEKVLSIVSKAIEHSTEQELHGRAPLCDVGIWYQPTRPAQLLDEKVAVQHKVNHREKY